MKAKVIRKFKDKNTNKIHGMGEEIKITEKRFEEINSTSFGVFVEKIEKEPENKPPKEPNETKEPEKQGEPSKEPDKDDEKSEKGGEDNSTKK